MNKGIKSNWNQVSVNEYLQIVEIAREESFNTGQKDIKIYQILAGKDGYSYEELALMPLEEYYDEMKKTDFVYTTPKGEIKDYYDIEIEGKTRKYYLCKEIPKLTWGQSWYLMELTKDKDLIEKNLPEIISTLLLPTKPQSRINKIKSKLFGKKVYFEVEKYNVDNSAKISNSILNQMSITDATGISVFFYLIFQLFLETTRIYGNLTTSQSLKLASRKLKEQLKKEDPTLLKNLHSVAIGVGTPLLKTLVEVDAGNGTTSVI